MGLKRMLLGRRLASDEHAEQKIGVLAGLPAVGLDGLASSSYGPEAALTILIPLGAVGLHYIGPIILVILALLGILYFSYRQTIAAYPTGGGSYTVAKENLGTTAGLLAAAALIIDYVLNVAVAISAGVGALVSAFPVLQKYTLALCLLVLVLISLVNLRGTAESGLAFALPTYVFILSFAAVLVGGLLKAVVAGGHPRPVVPPPALPAAAGAAGIWLLLHSFASGCTAMTGVEAVSNGVTAFKDPAVKNAQRTLTLIVVILAALLGGIAWLSRAYGIGAMDQTQEGYQSVMSQLVSAVYGRGLMYYVSIGSLLAVLCLSANTSFVGFPRLCRLIAGDSFLPHAFTIVGRRLVYSMGILILTGAAALLLIGFRGITDRLIPLFAVGAFLAFTLSQAGMVLHWRKCLRGAGDGRGAGNQVRLWVNGVGAVATAAALVVILLAKFKEGAWITIIAIPALFLLFKQTKRHYLRVARRIRTNEPLDLADNQPPVVVLPTEGWNRLTRKALRFGMRLSPDVIAVHLHSADPAAEEGKSGDKLPKGVRQDGEADVESLRADWADEVAGPARRAGMAPPRLEVITSRYRKFLDPLLEFVEGLKRQYPGRQIAVIVPELVKRRWWQYLLHRYRAERLKSALIKHGGPEVVVISIPWYADDPVPLKSSSDDRNADDAEHESTRNADGHGSGNGHAPREREPVSSASTR